MASKSGRSVAGVKLGTYVVAGQGIWTFSGMTRTVLDDTAFDTTVDKYQFGRLNGGTITFSGNYDPADTTGQNLLDSAVKNASYFTGGDLKIYIDNTSYFTVDTGGNIMMTKARAITMDKNGLGQCSFEGQTSNGVMVLI